jgi:dTDP-4-dehydrorhamnose reductase
MTRLLLFGAGGQVGREIADRAGAFGIRLAGRTRQEVDIGDAAAVGSAMREIAPDIVVNAAAYTKVDQAETEAEAAFQANAAGARRVAQACAAAGVPLVHLSTDYVFDGRKAEPYREEDATGPLGVYGQSKAAGEEAVREACPEHLILRTSWVFGRYGANFVKTVLRLATERDTLRIVADQHGCPTAAADIAAAVLTAAPLLAAGDAPWGTYHFASGGATTWHGFAQEIVAAQARLTGRRVAVTPIATVDYPTPARRPANSRLDSGKFAATFRFHAEPWEQRVRDVVGSLNGGRKA